MHIRVIIFHMELQNGEKCDLSDSELGMCQTELFVYFRNGWPPGWALLSDYTAWCEKQKTSTKQQSYS